MIDFRDISKSSQNRVGTREHIVIEIIQGPRSQILFGVFRRLMVLGSAAGGCNIKELKGAGSVHKHVFLSCNCTAANPNICHKHNL